MRRRILAAVVALTLCLVPGCAKGFDVAASNADLSNPDGVIATALETMFTWQPAKDASPGAAFQRAAIYMTESLAAQAAKAAQPAPDSQWEQWKAANATVTAKAYPVADETPPNSENEVHRVVLVIQNAMTPQGQLIREVRTPAWVTANLSAGGWRVSNIAF